MYKYQRFTFLLFAILIVSQAISQAPNPNLPEHVSNYPDIQPDALQSILWHEQYLPEERMLFKMMLQILGYPIEPQDPLWNPSNSGVVKRFQKEHKIRVDGKVGPETMGTMLRALMLYYEQISDIPYVIDLDLLPPGVIIQNRERIRIGEIVKYFHSDLARFRYARVLSVHSNRVEILDWTRKETFIVDIDDLNR